MRLFFGLEAEPATALEIAGWRDREMACDGRPVPVANLHITLAFVGELAQPAIEQLCLSVDDWHADTSLPGGMLTLDQTGYWHKPGILWVGPSRWPDQLDRLAAKLRSLSSAAGARRDRNPFQPHITLFRGCQSPPPAACQGPVIELAFDRFTLFESRQGRRGVSYHPLQAWELAASFG